jgi:hypothetical protein
MVPICGNIEDGVFTLQTSIVHLPPLSAFESWRGFGFILISHDSLLLK